MNEQTTALLYEKNNFAIEDELTVTITLNEYRELVGSMAVMRSKLKEAAEERLRIENEKEECKKEVERLREVLVITKEIKIRNDTTGAAE